MCVMAIMSSILDGIGEKLHDGQTLMTYMEGCGKLAEDNLVDLKGLLKDIYRMDLIKRLDKCHIGEN